MIGRLLYYTNLFKKNLSTDYDTLRKAQLKKLRAILTYAYDNIPFYRRRFNEANLKPNDIASVEDLKKIPVTTKEQVQTSYLSYEFINNPNRESCIWRSTSGSTGIPLSLALDAKTVDIEGAIWYRAFMENGLHLADKMSIIEDPRSFPENRRVIEKLGLLKRQHLSIFDSPQRQLGQLELFTPHAIKGYPSSLVLLADFCKQHTHSFKPRLVFTSSETLDQQSRKQISNTFGADLFDNYACNEFALMAWECSAHSGYHINVDSVVMEFVKDDECVSSGERGEIVCTSLLNRTMPLIRYKLGDIGIPLDDPCSCGRSLPLMKMVEGRADDFLIATDGRLISPTVFFPYPFKDTQTIKQFRVIQEKQDKLTIQIVPQNSFCLEEQALQDARYSIKQLFGVDMEVEFQFLDKIERNNGKLRKVVSKCSSGKQSLFNGESGR